MQTCATHQTFHEISTVANNWAKAVSVQDRTISAKATAPLFNPVNRSTKSGGLSRLMLYMNITFVVYKTG